MFEYAKKAWPSKCRLCFSIECSLVKSWSISSLIDLCLLHITFSATILSCFWCTVKILCPISMLSELRQQCAKWLITSLKNGKFISIRTYPRTENFYLIKSQHYRWNNSNMVSISSYPILLYHQLTYIFIPIQSFYITNLHTFSWHPWW